MTTAALSISSLTKQYDELKALDDVSFEIEQGSFIGLLGPNGAGKTTIISIIGGLTSPSNGSVKVMGNDLLTDPLAVRRLIGIVPQELTYDPFFNVREYLVQQASYYDLYQNGDWIDHLIETLGLSDKTKVNTRKLSGGMKRRLMVAMALVHKPPLLILDEPTAGVDITLRRSMWDFVRKLNTAGTTVLLTTHNLDEAEELCGRIIMMNHGKILANAKTTELVANGVHGHLQLFLRLADNAQIPAAVAKLSLDGKCQQDSFGRYMIKLNKYLDIEQVLASCRENNLEIAEMEIAPPDLEDIFVSLTSQVN